MDAPGVAAYLPTGHVLQADCFRNAFDVPGEHGIGLNFGSAQYEPENCIERL